MDQDRVVLLGVVQETHSVDNSSPYVSKAGGTPVCMMWQQSPLISIAYKAWYSDRPYEAANLTCSNCNKSLFLVAQAYAPVETDRTLYVFGCNSAACTEIPGSWRVLRDQVELVKEDSSLDAIEEVTKKVTSAWTLDSDDSDWSDEDDDSKKQASTVDLVDLEVLLQQRNNAMSRRTKTIKCASTAKTKEYAGDVASSIDRNAFSALLIEVIEEPYKDYMAERDFEHENRLLEEYMKQEEEEESTDIGDLRNVISELKKKKQQDTVQYSAASSLRGEYYENTPAEQRHLLRFKKRISRCPLQCLRYDYGGEPLWPVVIPQDLEVPYCPGCGEERFFEMQLNPTITYFLKVDEYAGADTCAVQSSVLPSSSTPSLTSNPVIPTGGMDWLSLIVYSCSASCTKSHEEFIYVVPSTS